MRPVNQCLNPQLASICQQAMELEELQKKVKTFLPDNMKESCHAGSFNKGCLTITTSDAVWASQLRYLIPELRDKLRKDGFYKLISIKVSVAEPLGVKLEKPKKKPKAISENARSIILSESENCTDEALKKALRDLAKP